MSRQLIVSLCMITVLLYSAVALSEVVPDTGAVTASTTPEDANVIVEPVSAQGNENWVDMSVTGSYTGSPEHKNTEQIPGIKQYKFVVTCDGVVFKDGKSSLDWQANDTFAFAIKSTSAAKYTVTMVVSVRVAINKKKSDGTAGDFIEWSPVKSVTVTRDVWLVGVKEIKVKPHGAGDDAYIVAPQEVVLLVGSKCVFKAFKEPEDAPSWPAGMPISKLTGKPSLDGVDVNDVTAISPGSVIQSFECGNRKFVTLTVVKPELVSVDFKDGGIQTITDVGTEPEWVKADANGQGARDEPLCIKRLSSLNICAVFKASKNLTFPTPVKVSFNGHGVSVDVIWQNWTSSATITYNPNIASIMKFTTGLVWDYSLSNGQSWLNIDTSNHLAYVIWDDYKCPAADFTKAHIEYACETANGATTLAQIGDMIGPNATGSGRFKLQNNHVLTPWVIIDDNVKSDCVSLCTLMKRAIQLLGNNSAEIWFVYACNGTWNSLASTSSTANEACLAHNGSHLLNFWNGGLNSYEGCCRFQGKWWMGGIGISKPHPLEVLRSVTSPNTVNGHTSGSTHHQCMGCLHPVSYPISTGGVIPPLNTGTNPPSYPSAIPNF